MRLLLAITLLASGLLSAQSTVKHGQEYTFHGVIHNKYPITLIFQQYENDEVKGSYYYDKIGEIDIFIPMSELKKLSEK